jgi:glycosyltransferase involved in cell wall biosynthesis
MAIRKLKIAIDASSTKEGGSQTHLVEVLKNISNSSLAFIDKIYIVSNTTTLNLIEDKNYIVKFTTQTLNRNTLFCKMWVFFCLNKLVQNWGCDILLDLSGTYNGKFRPYVGMSRNMLLYEKEEVERFESFYQTLRFYILRKMQLSSFNKAAGIIFISNYAKNNILDRLKAKSKWRVIHHGVSKKFEQHGYKSQKAAAEYSLTYKYKLLYISNILGFKHHLNVAKAIIELNMSGYNFELLFVGASHDKSIARNLIALIKKEAHNNITYLGKVSYSSVAEIYHSSDAFIFASSCENMPNILIEAMASGLPVICSNYGPMPEFGKNAVEYFDPTSVDSLKRSIVKVFADKELRKKMLIENKTVTASFSWNKCSDELFDFLNDCVINKNR